MILCCSVSSPSPSSALLRVVSSSSPHAVPTLLICVLPLSSPASVTRLSTRTSSLPAPMSSCIRNHFALAILWSDIPLFSSLRKVTKEKQKEHLCIVLIRVVHLA